VPTGLLKFQEWYRMVPFAVLAFVLGVWGFYDCRGLLQCPKVSGLQDTLLPTISLIKPTFVYLGPQYPWKLVLAAILWPSLAFVSAFNIAVQNLRRDMRIVWARRKRNHTIVCGLGQTGSSIVNGFCDEGLEVVAITLDPTSPEALSCERRGVPVLGGNATQVNLLKLAGVEHAKSIVIACASDSKNVEIGMRARTILEQSGSTNRSLKIFAEMRSAWLYDTFLGHQGAALGSSRVDLQLFNLDTNGARAMLQSPAFINVISRSDMNPHMMFAGFGQMGSEVLVQAALCNFALPGRRVAATILDSRGEISAATVEAKCSHIGDVTDLTQVPCSFAFDDTAARSTIERLLVESAPPLAVVVALATDDIALHSALEIRRCLDRVGRPDTPVFVRLREKHKLGAFLSAVERRNNTERLVPFGDFGALTKPSMLLDESNDKVARATHEIFLKYPADSNAAIMSWMELPEMFKQQNRDFANYIPIVLWQLRLCMESGAVSPFLFTDEQIETLAEMEHWRWSLVLKAHGWRWGSTRSRDGRLHPLLLEWTDLPESAKMSNRNMVRRIPEILASANFGIRRLES
jgi:hypothetical protein